MLICKDKMHKNNIFIVLYDLRTQNKKYNSACIVPWKNQPNNTSFKFQTRIDLTGLLTQPKKQGKYIFHLC